MILAGGLAGKISHPYDQDYWDKATFEFGRRRSMNRVILPERAKISLVRAAQGEKFGER